MLISRLSTVAGILWRETAVEAPGRGGLADAVCAGRGPLFHAWAVRSGLHLLFGGSVMAGDYRVRPAVWALVLQNAAP